MAVELKVTGNGYFKGASSNLTGYSATEDSTPIAGGDSSGGVGQLSFEVIEARNAEGTILLLNDVVELTDGSNGRTQATVNAIQSQNDLVSVSADSRLGQLNAEVTAQVYTGTLGGLLTYYFNLGSIVTGISIDSSIAGRTVNYQGWQGNLWNMLKQLCVAQQIEISLVSSNVVVRPLRTRIAQNVNNVSESWSVKNGDLARSVEVYYYNNNYKTDSLVYPIGGWTPDVQPYSVEAGQVLEINIPIEASIVPGTANITQPVPVLFVPRYQNDASVYAVAGRDGLPIPPQQWIDGGGSVNVVVADDSKSLNVTIVGAKETRYAPYRLAVASGPSDYYSALRIIGTGVFFKKELYTALTGAPFDKAPQVVGTTIDNPFITTLAQAQDAAMRESGRWAYPDQFINFSAVTINRPADKGTFNYPTFTDFDAQYAGLTFGGFDARPEASGTFGDFDAYQAARVQDNFDNQAFGNVGGARVRFREQWYRVRSGTITQEAISYSAERDTLFGDFDALWSGKTFANFDARWAGKTFGDFGVITLWQ